MSERTKFWVLLVLLVLSIALVIWLSKSYTQVLINPNH
jgi:hypothetical protein